MHPYKEDKQDYTAKLSGKSPQPALVCCPKQVDYNSIYCDNAESKHYNRMIDNYHKQHSHTLGHRIEQLDNRQPLTITKGAIQDYPQNLTLTIHSREEATIHVLLKARACLQCLLSLRRAEAS